MSNYYQPGNTLGRSSSGHLAYSPSHWKSYVIGDINNQTKSIKMSRYSQRGGSPQNFPSNLVYEPVPEPNDEKTRKKQQMMRRVKEIQQKVKPLIENDSKNIVLEEVGTKNKLQQKVAKLQTLVDAIEKEIDIKIEKRMLQVEKLFIHKLQILQQKLKIQT